MEPGLKKFFILGLLLYAGSAGSANLCNQNCLLTVGFPGGGSIEAVESLSITFGDGGLVDTVGSVTAYVAGETLILNAGESLVFAAGGSFDLGNGGNIDYTDLAITTDGDITLGAVGGDEQVLVPAGSRLSFPGGGLINESSEFVLSGTLDIGSSATLNISGPALPDGCDLSSPAGVTLSVSGLAPLVLDNNAGCGVINTTLISMPVVGSGSLTLTDPGTSLIVGSFNPAAVPTINVGSLTLTQNDEDSDEESDTSKSETSSKADESNGGSPDLLFLLLLAGIAAVRRVRR